VPLPADCGCSSADATHQTASPPQAGKGTLGIGIISYDGHVRVTIVAE
jgi:hypothetical protein